MDIIRITIMGGVPSKSNAYRIITMNGHASLCKGKALKEYEKSFYMQNQHRNLNIEGFFKVSIDVFNENYRKDLDNAAKIILDCLQSSKTIKNDRNCVELHMRKIIDKVNPRAEITIEEIEL